MGEGEVTKEESERSARGKKSELEGTRRISHYCSGHQSTLLQNCQLSWGTDVSPIKATHTTL